MIPAAARIIKGFLTPGEKLAEQTGKAMTDVCATMQDFTYAAKRKSWTGEIYENLASTLFQATKLDAMQCPRSSL
jgi:hypothetical protein